MTFGPLWWAALFLSRLDDRIPQPRRRPLDRRPLRIEPDRTAHDVVGQLPRDNLALGVAAFRSELRQAVADGGFFLGWHARTMPRSVRSVQRLSATAA